MNLKDQKIINDAKNQNIPIMVFTAKDKFSLDMIIYYKEICQREGCSDEFISAVEERIFEFGKWRESNPERIKIPD